MNPATLELIESLLLVGEKLWMQVQDIIAREKAGNSLTDAEIQSLKSGSDAAHAAIQSWKPPAK